MTKSEIFGIIKRYNNGTASKEERRFVETGYDLLGIQDGADEKKMNAVLQNKLLLNIWKHIHQEEKSSLRKPKLLVRYKNIAAVAIVLLVSGVFFFLLNKKEQTPTTAANKKITATMPTIIKPAAQKAMLTLANGKKITLGGVSHASLIGIAKQDSGQLVYRAQHGVISGRVQYNTLSTPRGGKFKIVLSDGTKVWMNAGSSLYYPVAFQGKTRNVRLEGEAYFEIAQQKDHPFIVEAGKSEVQVLGTHFNIKAYKRFGDIIATLAEGKIRVVNGVRSQLLEPGEQAVINRNSSGIAVKKVNVKAMLAWKNDLFYFESTNIKQIMNELSRWYDVDVKYKTKDLEKLNFSGVMSRYSNIKAVLKRLSLTGTVHFEIMERTVTVM